MLIIIIIIIINEKLVPCFSLGVLGDYLSARNKLTKNQSTK